MIPRMSSSTNDAMKESAMNHEDFASLFRYSLSSSVSNDTSAREHSTDGLTITELAAVALILTAITSCTRRQL